MDNEADLARTGTDRPRGWRWVLGIGVPLLVVVAVGLAYFQPWQLFVDKAVDDAAPVGAAPIAAATPTTETSEPEPATTNAPATSPATTVPATSVPAATVPATTLPATTVPATPSMFVSLDHGTSGSLLVLADDQGRRFARIENLATDQGPDVFVYLSTNTVDGPEGAFDDDYVDLGGLQGNLGNQNYEIPAGTDLTRYRSLVIWCDRFDSAFGAAPLPT